MRSLLEVAQIVAANGSAPTSDDVTLLDDGRRIRTAADLRRVIAEFEARSVEPGA